MFALLNMFNFLAVKVSTMLLIRNYNQTLPFNHLRHTALVLVYGDANDLWSLA